MRRNISWFMCFLLLISCSQESQVASKIFPLKKVNDKVAFMNKCKLTSEVNNLESDQVNLTIESSYNDLLFPGKVLHDFYHEVNSSELNIKRYTISNEDSEIYALDVMELSNISRRRLYSKSIINKLNKKKFSAVYNSVDSTVQSQMSLDVFESQMAKFDLSEMNFSGFMLFESYLLIGYVNQENLVLLKYQFESDDNILLGIKIE